MKYVNTKQLVETLNISHDTLKVMEEKGLPYSGSGRSKSYNLEEVQSWIQTIRSEIPSLTVGEVYDNETIAEVFKCGNMGGMRRSHTTNTLVIFSDHTKGLYDDRWNEDILHYTGMGLTGDQDLNSAQNKTLNESNETSIDVYLFETFVEGNHIFRGPVALVDVPYQESQEDMEGKQRNVWIFPLKVIETTYVVPQEIVDEKLEAKQKKAQRLSDEKLKERAQKDQKISKRVTTSESYERNPYVVEYTRRRAKGHCELCEEPAPFTDKKGNPFLEVHHVDWLSNDGEDSIHNTVGVCPNCHRKLHALNEERDVHFLKRKLKHYKAKE